MPGLYFVFFWIEDIVAATRFSLKNKIHYDNLPFEIVFSKSTQYVS